MVRNGIAELPIAWVIETRTRSGKSPTKPHIHGVAICEDPSFATKLKVSLESSIGGIKKGRARQRLVHVERGYEMSQNPMGRYRWVSYITKNAQLYDKRLGKRRVYISRSYTQIAKLAWDTRRLDW